MTNEELSTDLARVAEQLKESTERGVRQIMSAAQEECQRLIEQAKQQAIEIMTAAEQDAARIEQAWTVEGTPLNAKAQRRTEEIRLLSRQLEDALRALEEACETAAASTSVLRQVGVEPAAPTFDGSSIYKAGDEAFDRARARERRPASKPSSETIVDPASFEIPLALGSVGLVVSPFGSFRSLAAFQKAVEELDGVRSAKVRRFHRGTLYQVVQYDGAVPLEERLENLVQFRPRVVSRSASSIELKLDLEENKVLEASMLD
ncbi:MAG: hypothetical protein M1343_01115 [Chloroflexi bacterium]|nr:hypothetical protein [Chloroflexota bacterium]MDA8187873.1 hypothetical protein [Dehalococcoidales bacterium]